MIFTLLLLTAFFLAGTVYNDSLISRKIRRAASPHLDSIAFGGRAIEHIRALSILEDGELRHVVSNI